MNQPAMLPDDEALPAVPSDRVLRLGSFTTMPAFIDLAMMQLFSGWHPTTFTFGLCAASTLAMPTVQSENAIAGNKSALSAIYITGSLCDTAVKAH